MEQYYSLLLPVYHANDVSGCSPHRNFLVFCLVDRMKITLKGPKCPRGT
jgi:hypothetical protein